MEDTYSDGPEKPTKWYQGRSGKVSAKRVSGVSLILSAMVVALLSVVLDYQRPGEILTPLLSSGSLLLGSGVLERFGSTSKTRMPGE